MENTQTTLLTVAAIGAAIGLAWMLSRKEDEDPGIGPWGRIDDVDWNLV